MRTKHMSAMDIHPAKRFVSYFTRQVSFIASLSGSEEIEVDSNDPETKTAIHKKVLYSAILDSLAGIRFRGEIQGNRKRLIALLEQHASWPDGGRVSTPILLERLGQSTAEESLRAYIHEILAHHSLEQGNTTALSVLDETLETILPLARNDRGKKLVRESRHFDLFYRYRNFIVHEFREPGYAMEVFADGGEEPAYHGASGKNAKWRLLYPTNFFRAKVVAVLGSLEEYFVSNSIDPYSRVKRSDSWLAD